MHGDMANAKLDRRQIPLSLRAEGITPPKYRAWPGSYFPRYCRFCARTGRARGRLRHAHSQPPRRGRFGVLIGTPETYCLSSALPWSTPFDDPIPQPGGRKLVTLKDAADYITKLPKGRIVPARMANGHSLPCLIETAEGRDFLMHARIEMLRALNAGKPNPDVTPRGKKAKAYRIVR